MAERNPYPATLFSATLNLLNTCMGGGTALIALSYAMSKMGLAFGVAMFALFAVLTAFSLWLLVWAVDALRKENGTSRSGAQAINDDGEASALLGATLQGSIVAGVRVRASLTYTELGRRAFGNAGLMSVHAAILVNNAGSVALFLCFLGSIVPPLTARLTGLARTSPWLARPCVLGVLCALLYPLLLLKRIDALKPASLVSVAAASVLVAAAVYAAVHNSQGRGLSGLEPLVASDRHAGQAIRDVFTGLPILVFVYMCQFNVTSISNCLPGARRARTMWLVSKITCVCAVRASV